jgi:anti-anti-sigma factor
MGCEPIGGGGHMNPGEIHCLLSGDVTVIRVAGEFDETLVAQFMDAVAGVDGDVVVQLGGVTYADSSALRCLVMAKQALSLRDRILVVASPSEPVVRLLEITGLLDEFGNLEA